LELNAKQTLGFLNAEPASIEINRTRLLVELQALAHRIMRQRRTAKAPCAVSHLSHEGRPPSGSTGCQINSPR
jgi:hypothetical protein